MKKDSQKKICFLSFFLLTMFESMLKYTYVSQQADINRQQAIDIAENRTFSYQQIHAKKAFSLMSVVFFVSCSAART